jgi:hypothetical protein
MKPIKTKNTNMILNKPKNWNEAEHGECVGLPVVAFDGVFISYWSLSWRERFAVLFGKPIRLAVIANGHPPVALGVEP